MTAMAPGGCGWPVPGARSTSSGSGTRATRPGRPRRSTRPSTGCASHSRAGPVVSYLHRDHLGSLAAASNAAGGEVASARYWPFGGLRSSTGTLPTDRLLTGQIRDLGDDRFYFFKARYFDATIGKFVQPDSIVPKADNPQALNRYAYALNNPLKLVDPSGHDAGNPNDQYQDLTNISDPTLQAAAGELWEHGGAEGRQIISFLRAHQSGIAIIAQAGSAGATINTPFGSAIYVGTDGSLVQTAGVLAHETVHLEQGHTVVTQADEIQAYQMQGRILRNMGVPDADNPWGATRAQLYTVRDRAAVDLLYRYGDQYRNFPITRPSDVPHLAVAYTIEVGSVAAVNAPVVASQAVQALSSDVTKVGQAFRPIVARTVSPFAPSYPAGPVPLGGP